ncbi:MAG: hypothetical protein NVS2B17_20820 [Candidatus Velthaea sp.]
MIRFGAAILALSLIAATPAPEPAATPSPQRVLALIRNKFRSHRPPPAYVSYAIQRKQMTDRGYIDYAESYTDKLWCRSLDRAALRRRMFPYGGLGPPEFERPAFNEARDPGPPTADIFEPAPKKPTTIADVPTPEPNASQYQKIGSVSVSSEYDYYVDDIKLEANLLHLFLRPVRDPERNRLREVYADKTSYEVTRLIAHDRLFVDKSKIYDTSFDIRVGVLEGRPVVTSIHGVVGRAADGTDYSGDGKDVDYTFRDIKFPADMPDWYFNPRSYAQHQGSAPG